MFSALHREEGQGLAEYALILAFIALVVLGAFAAFGSAVQTMFSHISSSFGGL